MKKIGFLIMNIAGSGGTERATSIIANGLSDLKYDVSIISCREGNSCRYPLNNDVLLHSLHGENISNPLVRKFAIMKSLQTFVMQNGIEAMIAVDVALYPYLYPLQAKGLCKCIAWEHFNYYIQPNYMVKAARKLATKKADCVVVLGKNDLENYKSHYKNINKITYIYNPIAVDCSHSSTLTAKRAIAVGRFSKQKGFDQLIDAWKIIESTVPDWQLDIFGEGELRDELQSQIDNLNLQNVHLRGYTADIESEYLNSSLFFLSSRYEGFVLVLIEALAMGLPCISFNCKEGPAETIDDGINGYLIKNGNTSQFANAAIELMTNKTKLLEFGKRTKKDLDRFATKTVIQKWHNLLCEL